MSYVVADDDRLGESCVMTERQMRRVLRRCAHDWADDTDRASVDAAFDGAWAMVVTLESFARYDPERALELCERTGSTRAIAYCKRIIAR